MTTADPVQLEPMPAVVHPEALSRELLALTVLSARIKARSDELREAVAGWQVGVKQTVTLPNPDNPARPFKAGEVRLDHGATVARISDRAAFENWARENAAQNVVIEAEHDDAPTVVPPAVRLALQKAFDYAAPRTRGTFAEPAGDLLWRALREMGWQLAEVNTVPEKIYVQPGYVAAVLRMSKDAEEPVAPGGLVPAGVEVTTAPGKPYVSTVKDGAIQDGLLYSARAASLGILAALVEKGGQ